MPTEIGDQVKEKPPVKVSEEAKQEGQTQKLKTYYKQQTNESLKQSNIVYNEGKDRTYQRKSQPEATTQVAKLSSEAERSERLRQLEDNAVQTKENFKYVLNALEEVRKAH